MDIMMSMRDRHETEGEKTDKNFPWTPDWRSSAVPVCPTCLTIYLIDPQLTLGSKILTCDRTWDGG